MFKDLECDKKLDCIKRCKRKKSELLLGICSVFLIISLMLLTTKVCKAEEVSNNTTQSQASEQSMDNTHTYFTGNIQKQEPNTNSKQRMKNHFTFFSINIQANKITEIKSTDVNKESEEK